MKISSNHCFSYVPLLFILVHLLSPVTLVICYMVLISTPNLFVKVLATYANSALYVFNFVTMLRSAVASMARLSRAMEISTTACTMWYLYLIVVGFIFSQLS